MATNLDYFIAKLKRGEPITWQFVDCKKDLLSTFGGKKSFSWNISDLTYVKLVDPNQKPCI